MHQWESSWFSPMFGYKPTFAEFTILRDAPPQGRSWNNFPNLSCNWSAGMWTKPPKLDTVHEIRTQKRPTWGSKNHNSTFWREWRPVAEMEQDGMAPSETGKVQSCAQGCGWKSLPQASNVTWVLFLTMMHPRPILWPSHKFPELTTIL